MTTVCAPLADYPLQGDFLAKMKGENVLLDDFALWDLDGLHLRGRIPDSLAVVIGQQPSALPLLGRQTVEDVRHALHLLRCGKSATATFSTLTAFTSLKRQCSIAQSTGRIGIAGAQSLRSPTGTR